MTATTLMAAAGPSSSTSTGPGAGGLLPPPPQPYHPHRNYTSSSSSSTRPGSSSSNSRPTLSLGGGGIAGAAGVSGWSGSTGMASPLTAMSSSSSAFGRDRDAPTSSSGSGSRSSGGPASNHQARPSMHDRSYTSASTYTTASSSSLSAAATSSTMTTTTNNIDSPVAANSIANRTANAAYGLYQTCLTLRKQLRRVPGFAEAYLDAPSSTGSGNGNGAGEDGANGAGDSPGGLTSPISPSTAGLPNPLLATTAATPNDPVSHVCKTLRLGSSLCFLWNALGQGKPLDVNPDAGPTNFKACQRSAAHFIMACNTQLGWNDDDMFRITELYSPDTNGTVKVIHSVSKFVRLLNERGLLLPEEEEEATPQVSTSGTTGMDPRDRVVREILESERKYVQDLEVLQDYQRKLAEDGIVSQDTIHNLFLNLNAIVDFARKVLIGIEANASLPPEQQRFGSVFTTMEDGFSCYQPYCANFLAASDLAATLARQENSPLSRVSHILDSNELTMFHIKPVQRLLKYHLLWDSLLKATDSSWPFYVELMSGTECTKRINEKVNEETRKQDNRQCVEELKTRVEDWSMLQPEIYIRKGHDIAAFGELLLQDTFEVLKSDVKRDYAVYLFQKIILCCKDAPPTGKNKMSKSNSMIRKSGGATTPGGNKPMKPMLQLKGRIFINNIVGITPISKPNNYLLQINWRGDSTDEAFSIKCRTPDQLAQWRKAVDKAVDDIVQQRRSRSAGQMSARRLASPHSQFPNTPQFEVPMGSMNGMHQYHGHSSAEGHAFGFGGGPNGSSASLGSYASSNPYGGTFDDEGDEGYVGDYEPSTGRSTPSLTSDRSSGLVGRRGNITQSMPAGIRQERTHQRDSAGGPANSSSNNGRPRAQTEDSNSAVIHQWRSQTPNGGYPPAVPSLPRQSSSSSSTSGGGSAAQEGNPSLRHSASRNALRHKQSHEWGGPPMPPSTSSSSATSTASNSTVTSLRGQSLPQQMEEIGLGPNGEPLRMLRQNSQGMATHPVAPPPLRSRSASSPNVYQLNPAQALAASRMDNTSGSAGPHANAQWSPYPTDNVHPHHLQGYQQQQQQRPPLPLNHTTHPSTGPAGFINRKAPANQSTATIASTTGSATTNPPKRFSSSSTGTDRSSGDSSQSQPCASPVSPISNPLSNSTATRGAAARQNGASTPQPPAQQAHGQPPPSPSSAAVKLKVNYGEDTFVIVALSSISYRDLAEKVVRKIHLCGGSRSAGMDAVSVKLRYEDEDGDKIVMKADDDVAMAFDWLKSGGGSNNSLVIYAE